LLPKLFSIGIRPKHAEVWAYNQERVLQVILPPATKAEVAERAVQKAVGNWLETLGKQHLVLNTDVDIEGPYFCPFLENNGEQVYGKDLWLAKAKFRALKPRKVKEDLLVANRRLSEEVGMKYSEFRNAPERAMPDDAQEQLAFVKENADAVYRDLRDLKEKEQDDAGRDERA